ncbi:MAG: hypothetical protein EZS28_020469 [Streblomastix strix]|uniref:Uncharacterized protein n=1 Tax=Streblomastix strix TaxID=222440 RepID=A0A5J4VMX5_9EUKA|nr:MAG: hypothetical protein EZS28_020469 [Streblomastix strix]
MEYIFNNFLEDQYPFRRHALVLGDKIGHQQNVKGCISEKGFYLGVSIGSVDQVSSIDGNTHIAIVEVNYTDYELLKKATSVINADGMINIADYRYGNSINEGTKSMSWVKDVV